MQNLFRLLLLVAILLVINNCTQKLTHKNKNYTNLTTETRDSLYAYAIKYGIDHNYSESIATLEQLLDRNPLYRPAKVLSDCINDFEASRIDSVII